MMLPGNNRFTRRRNYAGGDQPRPYDFGFGSFDVNGLIGSFDVNGLIGSFVGEGFSPSRAADGPF